MTREQLMAAVEGGRKSFATKKTASLIAIGHAAVVYFGAARVTCSQPARDWLRKEIEKANVIVKNKNAERESDRQKGQASLSGKVTEETLQAEGEANPSAELDRLRALAALSDKEFRAGQFVKLKYEEAEDVSSTTVIRFVYGVETSGDAPFVSRHATVLDGVKQRFGRRSTIDVETVVEWIQSEGGFEAVLRRQRQSDEGAEAPDPKKTGQGQPGARKAGDVPAAKPTKDSGAAPLADEDYRSERIWPAVSMPPGMDALPLGLVSFHCIVHGPNEIEIVAYSNLTEAEMDELRRQPASALATADASNPDAPSIVPTVPASDAVGGEALD